MKSKRIGTIVISAALVTVGGVYATWSYSGGNAGSVEKILSMGITQAINTSSRGTLSFVNATDGGSIDNIKYFTVDQKDATDHTAVLKVNEPIVLKFTPSAGVKNDVAFRGTTVEIKFELTDSGKYTADDNGHYNAGATERDVFTVTSTPITVNLGGSQNPEAGKYYWTPVATGGGTYTYTYDDTTGEITNAEKPAYFTFTLSTEIISNYVKINNFYVDSIDEYNLFAQAVTESSIRLTATDATSADGTPTN